MRPQPCVSIDYRLQLLPHLVDSDIDLGRWAALDIFTVVVVADCENLLGQNQLEWAESSHIADGGVVWIVVVGLVADFRTVRVVDLWGMPGHLLLLL